MQTQARLLAAAFEVFAAKGFGRVSIEEVCDAAGYSRGAFYSNFDSLEGLFFALYQARAELLTTQLTEALTSHVADFDLASAVERLTEALLLERDWLLVKSDFLVYAARREEVAQALLQHRQWLQEAIAQRLTAVAEHGGLPPVLGGADGAARAVLAVYDGVTTQVLLDRDTEHARQWLKQLLLALLSPRSGTGDQER
ncbi:TetR/AcrR family transcriptional regulator [Streptomyces sp. NPDC006430]|uniref:TetR/AcrR family transcriptional regulator n=1 Tax=Streptomyces sp. NPDC006430 TaxID=3154299 RepID=UPI0033A7E760